MWYHHCLGCSCQASRYKLRPFLSHCPAAINTPAAWSEDSTVAVFGVGAIGLGVISTAQKIGALRIIAIDVNPRKQPWAYRFGATDFVDPSKLKDGQKIQDVIIEMTN